MTDHPELQLTATASLPTEHGTFELESFRFEAHAEPHLALSLGLDTAAVPLVRIHSECITGDVFGCLRCDCGEQLSLAMQAIERAGSGLIIYLRQEGRGIGIENKLHAYRLQERGLDTVDANLALGLPIDARSYGAAVAYLRYRQVNRCVLLTNNPHKLAAVRGHGIDVTRAPLRGAAHETCRDYLATKRRRLGHAC